MLIDDNGVIREMTEDELNSNQIDTATRIAILKSKLAETDYQAIKFAEGWISEEEYAPTKTDRQSWRNEINNLEAEQPAEGESV